mmetsp:Transcript_94641/g.170925  ORF Transcript_94641/g.170925 Transcript_94641/m.170925 type:complete len:89 (+) Transcript_94641:2-268(+)
MNVALDDARQALEDVAQRSGPFSKMEQVWDDFFVVYRHLLRYHMSEMLAAGDGTTLNYVHNDVISRGRDLGMFSTEQEGELVLILCAH